ncbi:MAG: hypothetical protein WCJ63_07995, partial [Actinomycetes bacterium]
MTELRQMTRAMLDLVLADGYGEVRTPTLEYETTSATALGPKPAYRLIDEHGDGRAGRQARPAVAADPQGGVRELEA